MPKIRPAFQVERLRGTVTRTKVALADGKLLREQYEEPAGFMVYFPQGHSLRVSTEEELSRLQLAQSAPLIDMETGEPFIGAQDADLRSDVERGTRKRRVTQVEEIA